MNDFRTRFTKWYYRKGYQMIYKPPCDHGENVAELIFLCPWWIRPFVEFLFSPVVFYHEAGKDFADCFVQGLKGE